MKCSSLAVVSVSILAAAAAYGQAVPGTVGTRAAPIEPARYPLELVSPRAANTAPAEKSPAIPGGHRIFRAYPGIPYEIRAVVLGGSYPYRFTLAGAPAGMTIDERTGAIRRPEPGGDRATPAVTVTDAEGASRSSAWTIAVSVDGFRFVDGTQGDDSNPGTRAAPWKSLAQIKASAAAGAIVYFRTATYRTTGMPTGGADTWRHVEFNGRVHPVAWLAYPGEKPVIDNDYVAEREPGRFIRLTGAGDHPVYLDGLEITGSRHIGLQYGSGSCDYAVFRRLEIHNIAEGIDGANSAGIMSLTSRDDPSWYAAFQDCDFHHNRPGGIKEYSQKKLLWEDCRFRHSGVGPDLKSDVSHFEVRGCSFSGNRGAMAGLFGNMHPAPGGDVSGEIRFNRMLCKAPSQIALEVNQDGLAGEIHVYRNTLSGVVNVRNADSSDGPFHFRRNVIVNGAAAKDGIRLESVDDPSRITYSENLSGRPADAIVDVEGNLIGTFRSFLGARGHQRP